ncbi:hypothetical protein DIPPA_31336 [Diplonema papillatum]|nr:hypothetical protein DIPPA_31336 [Diplonema papillatum]
MARCAACRTSTATTREAKQYLKSQTDAGGKGAKPDYSMQNAVSKGMRQQRAGGGEPAARKRPLGSSAMMSTGLDADECREC